MSKQTDVRVEPLTRELAQEFSSMRSLPGERPLKRSRVRFLRQELVDGMFHSPTWAEVRVGGVVHRMNGNHSSTMLSEAANGIFPHKLPVFHK